MVRIQRLNSGFYLLQGGTPFDPRTICLMEVPTYITEALAILKMLNRGEKVEGLGKKQTDKTYYIYMSPNVWESLVPNSVPFSTQHLVRTQYVHKTTKRNA